MRQISIKGRIVILAILGIGVIIMLYHIPPLLEGAIPYMYKIYLPLIIFMDIAIVIMLMPVMLLYAQQMKSERRESITFITIICGIILSRIAAYVYAIVFSISLFEVPSALHTGSILDVLYLFGYLIIAVGLYVHAKYDDWGFQQIEKALEAI